MSDDEQHPSAPPTYALGELMRRAMRTSYQMIARETLVGLNSAASIEALTEMLVAKGILDANELGAAREAALARIAGERMQRDDTPALTMATDEEQARPPNLVDCTTRHPRCGAACCVFHKVVLTADEVRAGKVWWDLAAPYALPRTATGQCAYLDDKTLACTVWNDRPHVCRGYSCRDDDKIWSDFAGGVPTERVIALTRSRTRR
jgi:hypothetical protein